MNRNIKIRAYIIFFKSMAGTMIFPLLLLDLVSRVGAAAAGTALFSSYIVGIFGAIVVGQVLQFFRTKTIIVLSEIFRTLGFLFLLGSVERGSTIGILVSLMIVQFFTGSSIPATEALILDSTDGADRRKAHSFLDWISGISFSIGALLGAVFGLGNFTELLILTIICSMAVTLTASQIEEQSEDGRSFKLNFEPFAYFNVLTNPNFVRFFFAGLIVLSLDHQLGNYIHLQLSQKFGEQTVFSFLSHNISVRGDQLFGILKALNLQIVILFSFFIRKIYSLYNEKICLVVALSAYAVGIGLLTSSNDFWLLVIGVVIMTWGEIIVSPIRKTLIGEMATNNTHRGQYLAVHGLTNRLAMAAGSFAVVLGSQVGATAMSFIFSISAFVSLGLFLLVLGQMELSRSKA